MGHIRIIAGSLRGRRIPVPEGALRPTPDRAREGLFNILAPRIDGARVLDAFAGTGALGFEALSRGAAHAVFLERERTFVTALRRRAAELGVEDRARVLEGEAVATATGGWLEGPFDLILADPPYGDDVAAAFAEAAVGLLADDGLLVLERDHVRPPAKAPGAALTRSVRYGRTAFDLLVRHLG